MTRYRVTIGLTVALVAAAVASATALGGAQMDARDLPLLHTGFTPDAAQSGELDALARLVASGPPESMLAAVDLSVARPIAAAGGTEVWLAPSEDNLCVFSPQPGATPIRWSVACSTPDELRTTGSVSAVRGPSDTALVTVVTLGDTPRLISANGAVSQLPVQSNVATALARHGDRVEVADAELAIQ